MHTDTRWATQQPSSGIGWIPTLRDQGAHMSVGTSLNTVVQLAVPPAFVVSLALRWIYLRVVRRSMLRPVAGTAPPGDEASLASRTFPVPADPPSQRLEIASVANPARDAIRAAWRGPWVAVAVHVAAGLAYALVVTLVWAWLADAGMPGKESCCSHCFSSGRMVIVVGLIATVSWRAMSVVVLIYAALFLVGVAWLTHGTGITLTQIALNWWNLNGIGTLLVLGFLARPIKAMGPIVVALMMAATAGVFWMADLMSNQSVVEWIALIATNLGFSGNVGGVVAGLIMFGLAALAAVLVGYIALRGIGWLYKAQWISDQSIQIDAVWLIFAIVQAPTQQPLAGLAAFLIYELVARLGLHLFCPGNVSDSRPYRLLLLRVFSLGARSEYCSVPSHCCGGTPALCV